MKRSNPTSLLVCSLSALVFVSGFAVAEEAPKTESSAPASVSSATDSNLTFLDDQQAWTQSEVSGYEAWMKKNPRYSHPMFQSQYDSQRGVSIADDRPDPNYRPARAYSPWYGRGMVSNVRNRILWVNPRYPSYVTHPKGAEQPQKPMAEPAAEGTK